MNEEFYGKWQTDSLYSSEDDIPVEIQSRPSSHHITRKRSKKEKMLKKGKKKKVEVHTWEDFMDLPSLRNFVASKKKSPTKTLDMQPMVTKLKPTIKTKNEKPQKKEIMKEREKTIADVPLRYPEFKPIKYRVGDRRRYLVPEHREKVLQTCKKVNPSVQPLDGINGVRYRSEYIQELKKMTDRATKASDKTLQISRNVIKDQPPPKSPIRSKQKQGQRKSLSHFKSLPSKLRVTPEHSPKLHLRPKSHQSRYARQNPTAPDHDHVISMILKRFKAK